MIEETPAPAIADTPNETQLIVDDLRSVSEAPEVPEPAEAGEVEPQEDPALAEIRASLKAQTEAEIEKKKKDLQAGYTRQRQQDKEQIRALEAELARLRTQPQQAGAEEWFPSFQPEPDPVIQNLQQQLEAQQQIQLEILRTNLESQVMAATDHVKSEFPEIDFLTPEHVADIVAEQCPLEFQREKRVTKELAELAVSRKYSKQLLDHYRSKLKAHPKAPPMASSGVPASSGNLTDIEQILQDLRGS